MIERPHVYNIKVEDNTATILFRKPEGAIRTEINRLWVNGRGIYDDYTNTEAFHYEGLEWGKVHEFMIRSYNAKGEVSESSYGHIEIPKKINVTIPTDVKIHVEKNTALITFKKGEGKRTYVVNSWNDDLVESSGNGIYLDNLPWGLNGEFCLVTEGNDVETAETEKYTLKIEEEPINNKAK